MITTALRRLSVPAHWLLWAYLLLITLAELVTSVIDPQLGLTFHALLLLCFMVHGSIAHRTGVGQFALALTLAPLIRMLSVSLPLLSFPQMAWYPIVSVPLLIAMWLIVRQIGVPRQALGLKWGNLAFELPLASIGVGLGVIEYVILRPQASVNSLSWSSLLLPALSLLIFTGFTEEVIFRGLFQTLARPTLGRWAFVYVALLFAVLHVGYLSMVDVLFVFAVGLLFAYIVHWSGSILGVTLAHGLTNILLFLIMPYLELHPNATLDWLGPWLLWGSVAVSVITVVLLKLRAAKMPAQAPVAVSPATIRALRRAHGLSYASLAQRTGIPSRKLAAIEHGLHPLQPEHQQAIALVLPLFGATTLLAESDS